MNTITDTIHIDSIRRISFGGKVIFKLIDSSGFLLGIFQPSPKDNRIICKGILDEIHDKDKQLFIIDMVD